jgi:Kef-type K+ transport system membrane component KefB
VWVNNWSDQREELEFELHRLSPLVYLTFFTITGASLNLELLTQVWQAAILLFVIRLVGIGLGAAVGGMLAGEPRDQHRYRWMGFVTQAGVGLGLAQRVSSDFPGWGESFAALMIAVIVINEMVGPLFFKSAITKSGEAHANEDMTLETQETEEAQVAQTLKSESSATREVNPTQEIQPKRESSLV